MIKQRGGRYDCLGHRSVGVVSHNDLETLQTVRLLFTIVLHQN